MSDDNHFVSNSVLGRELKTEASKDAVSVEVTKFVDLNEDCLHAIFSKLDENDLASVSEVCKRFQKQAVATFLREFKYKKIWLRNLTTEFRLKASQVLRSFGTMLQKVYIVFENQKNDFFFNAIIDKCGFNLTEIDLICTASWTTRHKNSKRVLKKDFFLKFPNLRHLRIDIQVNVDPECIEEHFSTLEHLSLECDSFENANLRLFIRLNPQLKSLELTHYTSGTQITRQFLAFIDERLPQLQHFKLSVGPGSVFDNVPYQPLFFKNLKQLHIRDSRGRATVFPYLAICNKEIEEMDFHVYRCNQKLIDLICQHKELRKLTLYCDEDSGMDGGDLDDMAEKLPKLSELQLEGYYDDIYEDSIIKFTQNAKQLTRFCLQDFGKGEEIREYSKDVKNKLDPNEWEILCRPDDYEFEIRKKIEKHY